MRLYATIATVLFFYISFIFVSFVPSETIYATNDPESKMSSSDFYSEPNYSGLHTVTKTPTTTEPVSEPVYSSAHVTAYSEYDSCHYENCLMANGIPAQEGYVACPRRFALGTKVEIDGDEYICGDRTAERFDGRFDIFMGYGSEAYAQAINFGIRTLEYRVLE